MVENALEKICEEIGVVKVVDGRHWRSRAERVELIEIPGTPSTTAEPYSGYVPEIPLIAVTLHGTIVAYIGLQNGEVVVTGKTEDEKLAKAVLSVVPIALERLVEKIPDAEELVGIGKLFGELTTNTRDPTSPTRRATKKIVKKNGVTIVEEAYSKGFKDAFSAYKDFVKDGWRIVSRGGEVALRYDGRIDVEFIRKDGVIYPIPEEYRGKLYVRGITIPIRERIESILIDKHHHPNVSNGKMCLGEANGLPLTDITLVLTLLKTANLDSPYPGTAQMTADNILDKIKGESEDNEDFVSFTLDEIGGR